MAGRKRKTSESPFAISERAFQYQLEMLLEANKWVWKHDLKGRLPNGRMMTLVRGWAGFPDLIAVRDRRVVCIEVKSTIGRLSEKQRIWLELLEKAGVECYVWKPADLEEARRVLQRKRDKK